jgi:hypothetical protein
LRSNARWLVMALLTACQSSDQLVITFGPKGQGLEGFFCTDTQGRPIIDRCANPPLQDGGLRPINLVFDVIGLDGGPGCLTADLVSWCQSVNCSPNWPVRQCVPLPMQALNAVYISGDAGKGTAAALLEAVQGLAGTPLVSGFVSTDQVIIRAVATLEPCEGLAHGFDAGLLVGCAFSCPQPLGVASSGSHTVELEFDTGLSQQCTLGDVVECAGSALP